MPKNVDKKNQIFPEHFQLYVGTGMRAVCIFCTSCKNQKNSWGYPSNPNPKLIEYEFYSYGNGPWQFNTP